MKWVKISVDASQESEDAISNCFVEMGSGGDDKIPALNPRAWEILKIETHAFEGIMETMSQEFRDISDFIA